jgi:hypothetical protein
MTDAEKIRLLQFDRAELVELLADYTQTEFMLRDAAKAAIERELFDRRRSAGLGVS